MIRINLLTKRKTKSRRSEQGERSILIGLLIVIAAGALVFLFIDRGLSERVDDLQAQNAELRAKNKKIKRQTKDLSKVQAAVKAAEEQEKAIKRLREARSTPAWLLWELSHILTRGETGAKDPSMTTEMTERLQSDPNRQWQESWDPKHVWITKFQEKNGRFKLEGSAESSSDMTQLALRLQASMFFDEVQPEGGKEVAGKKGVDYYEFTISGKVRY